MKYKILFEMYMFVSMIFGQSINQVFFNKNTHLFWAITFALGLVYTIWWFYYLFKNIDKKD